MHHLIKHPFTTFLYYEQGWYQNVEFHCRADICRNHAKSRYILVLGIWSCNWLSGIWDLVWYLVLLDKRS